MIAQRLALADAKLALEETGRECLGVALLMWYVLARTRLGMKIRAGATHREMVQSLGVDITLLYRVVFAAGVALAVLAGTPAPVSI